MIHGDLKGVRLRMLVTTLSPNVLFIIIKANILIGEDRHARLADFGLLTITSDPTNFTASSSHVIAGTTRWMSPEILNPDLFGFKDSRPTKESDCYALGMVVFEVLSGRRPFTPDKDFIVMRKVIDGERPGRPEGSEGAWFTDDLWGMLELCWAAQSNSRPSIGAVLECLERVSGTWKPPSQRMGEDAKGKKQEHIRLAELECLRLEAEESAGRAEMERLILEVERMRAPEEEERLSREEEEHLIKEEAEHRKTGEGERLQREEEERLRTLVELKREPEERLKANVLRRREEKRLRVLAELEREDDQLRADILRRLREETRLEDEARTRRDFEEALAREGEGRRRSKEMSAFELQQDGPSQILESSAGRLIRYISRVMLTACPRHFWACPCPCRRYNILRSQRGRPEISDLPPSETP